MILASDISTSILGAERERCAAMLANDASQLDGLLDPRLSFSHATGMVDDKSAYMAKLAGGRIDYLSIDWSDENVIPLAEDAALLTGRMSSLVKVDGVEKRLDNRVLSAWSKTGGAWRVVAFQSTPLKV